MWATTCWLLRRSSRRLRSSLVARSFVVLGTGWLVSSFGVGRES